MAKGVEREWILPAAIPFADLKAKDLEECLYWLFDALGAKDLEWRTGGTGGGAADGGRDLEARFYTPGADNDIEPQIWWVECKGRKGTVEPDEVKSALNNALGKAYLDYIVIATNTQFSNPTRDWVKEWQAMHPRPKVRLWDEAALERQLSRHPDVVLRLFSQALSLKGRFHAMESRFWNKLEYVTERALREIWEKQDEVEFTAMGVFAAIVNEFAHGDITRRPWGANVAVKSLLEILQIGLTNVPYIMMRATKSGIDQKPIFRGFAYLILCAIQEVPADALTEWIEDAIYRDQKDKWPDNVKEILLMPIADQLLGEMQDVCSSNCSRISVLFGNTFNAFDKDEIENYWFRLESTGMPDRGENIHQLRLEIEKEPCVVGYPVGKSAGCPLYGTTPTIRNVAELLEIVKRVSVYRRNEARPKMIAKTQEAKAKRAK